MAGMDLSGADVTFVHYGERSGAWRMRFSSEAAP